MLKKKIIRTIFFNKVKKKKKKKKIRRFFTKKGIRYRRRKKRFFVWKKKKKQKKLRLKHNFVYFFKKRKKWIPRIARKWINFQLKKKYLIPENLSNLILFIARKIIKVRFAYRLKNNLKKKNVLIKKLRKHFSLLNKNIIYIIRKQIKKSKNKLFYFYFFLENQLSTICLRFHFFWRLNKAKYWINNGVISVNNLIVTNFRHHIFLNDLVKVVGPRGLWVRKLVVKYGVTKFHRKFYISLNYSELRYLCYIGILLKVPTQISEIKTLLKKRRKFWLKKKTVLFLVNSFY